MKIAVTGGTGFIGRPLVDRLAGTGHQILVLTRHPELAGRAPNIGAGFFDAMQVPRDGLLDGMDAVIHLAGESIAKPWTAKQKELILQSRQKGTEAIARASAQAKSVRTLVCASAIGFYGARGSEE